MNSELYHALSVSDIVNYFDGKIKVITSDKLYRIKNIDELLEPYGKCIILYLFQPNYGHYCALVRNSNTVYYVDSFGRLPDKVNSEIKNYQFRSQNHLDYKYLTKLLCNSDYNIEYNQNVWQDDTTSVCGRYCIVSCSTLGHDISLEQLQRIFNQKQKIKNDELVIKLTE